MYCGKVVDAEDRVVYGELYYSENAEMYIEYMNRNGIKKRVEVLPQTVSVVRDDENRSVY